VPIPDTKRVEYLEENVAAASIPLDATRMSALDDALAPEDFRAALQPDRNFHDRSLDAGAGRRQEAAGPDLPPEPQCASGFRPRSSRSGSTIGSRPRKARYIAASSMEPPRERIMSRKRWPLARVMPPFSLNQ